MKNTAAAVLGGDMRQVSLAGMLSDGVFDRVNTYAMEDAPSDTIIKSPALEAALKNVDTVILPLPLCDDRGMLNAVFSTKRISIEDVFDLIPPNVHVLAGKVGKKQWELAEKKNIRLTDYLEREEFAVYNAVSTAEGAIQIAMEEMPITLHRANALVVGFGRIGKILSHRLAGMGADVTVCARKCADRAWISSYGYTAADYENFPQLVEKSDVVFNTVPVKILGRHELKKAKFIIDLASKPGGVDLDAARELGVKVIWALSLPGKVAPITSAKIICDTILNIIGES